MKKLFLLFSLFFAITSLTAQTNTSPSQVDIAKVLKFTNDNYDMGKIP